MDYRILVIPCKDCRRGGADSYSVLAARQDIAEDYQANVSEDCPQGKCLAKVRRANS